MRYGILARDALGYPLDFILTAANVSGFDQARPLLRHYLWPKGHGKPDASAGGGHHDFQLLFKTSRTVSLSIPGSFRYDAIDINERQGN
jgi:hypothetical protein